VTDISNAVHQRLHALHFPVLGPIRFREIELAKEGDEGFSNVLCGIIR